MDVAVDNVEVGFGPAYAQIIEHLAERGHDLLVLRSDEPTSRRGLAGATTTMHLLRKCPNPNPSQSRNPNRNPSQSRNPNPNWSPSQSRNPSSRWSPNPSLCLNRNPNPCTRNLWRRRAI